MKKPKLQKKKEKLIAKAEKLQKRKKELPTEFRKVDEKFSRNLEKMTVIYKVPKDEALILSHSLKSQFLILKIIFA